MLGSALDRKENLKPLDLWYELRQWIPTTPETPGGDGNMGKVLLS